MADANELMRRYQAALHGVQSAIRYEIESGKSTDTTPKHLRTGINSALCDTAAMASLLMKKGVITEQEYLEAITETAELELDRYVKKYGVNFA